MKSQKDFLTGDKVFAKVKGYPPWPAKIDNINGKKYHVTFYGTKETGVLKVTDLYHYQEYKDQFAPKYSKKKDFKESITEIEAELSLTNNVKNVSSLKINEKYNIDTKNEINLPKKEKPLTLAERKVLKRTLETSTNNDESDGITEPQVKIKRTAVVVNRKSGLPTGQKSLEDFVVKKKQVEDTVENDNVKADAKKEKSFEEADANEQNDSKEVQEKEKNDPLSEIVVDEIYDVVTAMQIYRMLCELENYTPSQQRIEISTKHNKNRIVLARLLKGDFVGIEFNLTRPAHEQHEQTKIMGDRAALRNILRLRTQLERGEIDPQDYKDKLILNPKLSTEQRCRAMEEYIIQRKKDRLEWLQTEAKLIERETSIKAHLGLDKANTEEAIKCVDDIISLSFDKIMLLKHPFVVDVIKRLRRYIGNMKMWNLTEEEKDMFLIEAENIRAKADIVYQKFKSLFQIDPDKTFAEVFHKELTKFNDDIKHLNEVERFSICCQPGTQEYEIDQLNDLQEKEVHRLRKLLKQLDVSKGLHKTDNSKL